MLATLPHSPARPRPGVAKGVRASRAWGRSRTAFTLAESMIAMSVLAMAGAALLTSVGTAITSCNESLFQSVGRGLAEQLMEEIAATKFPTGSSATTSTAGTRATFTTIDDYSGWKESPLTTKSGEPLGSDQSLASESSAAQAGSKRHADLQASPTFMARFTRAVVVERVQPNGTGWTVVTQHTSYRRVTVQVSYAADSKTVRPVAELTRVFTAIPTSP